jgi:hypothetical protein
MFQAQTPDDYAQNPDNGRVFSLYDIPLTIEAAGVTITGCGTVGVTLVTASGEEEYVLTTYAQWSPLVVGWEIMRCAGRQIRIRRTS